CAPWRGTPGSSAARNASTVTPAGEKAATPVTTVRLRTAGTLPFRFMASQSGRRLLLSTALAICLAALAPQPTPRAADLFDEIYRRGAPLEARLTSISASFVETTTSTLLTEPVVARGHVVARRPAARRDRRRSRLAAPGRADVHRQVARRAAQALRHHRGGTRRHDMEGDLRPAPAAAARGRRAAASVDRSAVAPARSARDGACRR